MHVRVVQSCSRIFLPALALLALGCGATARAELTEKRVALVIGNGNYRYNTVLSSAINDANAMTTALRECGFEVVDRTDCTRPQFVEAMQAFSRILPGSNVALFYYSGHGMRMDGINFMAAIEPDGEWEPGDELASVEQVFRLIEGEDRVNILIFDACRNAPDSRAAGTRSTRGGRMAARAQPGWAAMHAPKGGFLAFATAPGTYSWGMEKPGGQGIYTESLLRHMMTPGLRLEDLCKRVRVEVMERSRDLETLQVPWEESSLIGDFYFVQGAGSGGAAVLGGVSGPVAGSQFASVLVANAPGQWDALVAELAARLHFPGSTRVRVSVGEFSGPHSDPGGSDPTGRQIKDEVSAALSRHGRFVVVARDNLADFQAERELAQTSLFGGTGAPEIRLGSVQALVRGRYSPSVSGTRVHTEMVFLDGGEMLSASITMPSASR